MKKFFIILFVILVTGCSNKITNTPNTEVVNTFTYILTDKYFSNWKSVFEADINEKLIKEKNKTLYFRVIIEDVYLLNNKRIVRILDSPLGATLFYDPDNLTIDMQKNSTVDITCKVQSISNIETNKVNMTNLLLTADIINVTPIVY